MAITIQFTVDEHGTIRDVQRINKELRATESAGKQGAQGLNSVSTSLGAIGALLPGITVGFAAWKAMQLGKWAVETAGNFEKMKITLDTLTKGDGERWFESLNAWAMKMPINTESAVQAFIKMRAMGLRPTIADMTTLVDTTSALGGETETFNGIVLAIGQIATKGKLMSQEVRQLAERGIPAYEILRDKLGLTGDEIENMGKKAIDADTAITALLTGMEERFGGQSEKIRGTYGGIIEEIRSNWVEYVRLMMEMGPFDFVKGQLKELRDMTGEMAAGAIVKTNWRDIAKYDPFSKQERISMKYMTKAEIDDFVKDRSEQARNIERSLASGKPFGLTPNLKMTVPRDEKEKEKEKRDAAEADAKRLDEMRKNLTRTFSSTFVEFGQGYSLPQPEIGMFGGGKNDYKNPFGSAGVNLDALQQYNEDILDLKSRLDEQVVSLSKDRYGAEIDLLKNKFTQEYGMLSENSEIRLLAEKVLQNDILMVQADAAEERISQERNATQEMESAVIEFGQTWGSIMQQVVRDSGGAFDMVKSMALNSLISIATSAIGNALFSFIPGGFGAGANVMFRKMFGFAEGGYTGSGSPGQVAGVVHKREYVLPQDVTDRYGPSFFDRLVTTLRSGGDNRKITNNFAFSPNDRREMMNLDDEQLANRMQKVINDRKVVF